MTSNIRLNLLALACIAAFAGGASAATVTVVNADGPGEGFNDPTVVAPLPSNPDVTLGAQRLRVVQAAANQWGALLQSSVEIKVRVAFNPLTCSGTSAVLGSAGATTIHSDFANAPFANTWYSAALANTLSGTDLNGTAVGQEEINSQYNSDYDNGVCITGTAGWYYSTQASDATPANRTALLPVVFHEFAHGLGFQTFTNSSSGAFNGGRPDVWTRHLMDASTGLRWIEMTTDALRQASAISDPNLVWAGPNVRVDKALFLTITPKLIVNSPAAIAGPKDANPAGFGTAVPPGGLTGELVLAVDDTAPTQDGCTAFTNPAAVAGKLALIERGTCTFVVKVKNAQLAGAIGAVVYNNAATGLPGMGGADPTIVIPSYGIGQADGNAIIAQLGSAIVNATMGLDPQGTLAGTSRGKMRMNAPNPVQPGSSVSHWTIDASPNLLMEPAINPNLFSDVDLTIALFRDIGWKDNATRGLYIFEGGFEEF